ncbi:unnamed protein product [Ceratitis capitata]|uniref:(Mediterranean fruit fly) hypothetical protein n=1 Tax=Ceratitis capitata TaxID=7213 RepID=A0A811UY51_CERCA|nr:unnamed protein product [Ceratitis capitata]
MLSLAHKPSQQCNPLRIDVGRGGAISNPADYRKGGWSSLQQQPHWFRELSDSRCVSVCARLWTALWNGVGIVAPPLLPPNVKIAARCVHSKRSLQASRAPTEPYTVGMGVPTLYYSEPIYGPLS